MPRQRSAVPTVLAAALACACAASLSGAARDEGKPPALRFDRGSDGWPVPEFTLTDQHGDALTRQRLLGQWTFVLFGDTRCRARCSDGLRAMAALRERIAGTQVVHSTQLVFVSLDGARDDAKRLAAYVAPYGGELVAATGSAAMLRLVADELGATQRAERAQGHDGALVLVGPEGLLRAVYLPPYDVRLLTADYMLKRAKRR